MTTTENEVVFEEGCHPFKDGYMCGLGGVIVRSSHNCPECGVLAALVVRYPNTGYFPPTRQCECGDSWDDEGRMRRPFRRGWREDAQRRFKLDWDKALPMGTMPIYEIDYLAGVLLPDGRRVLREGA